MSQNTIALLQAGLIFLQLVNAGLAGIAKINPIITILLSALVGAMQAYMQRLGNQSVSPQVASMLTSEQMASLPGAPTKTVS